MEYCLSIKSGFVGTVFKTLLDKSEEIGVVDWSFGQITLETVFSSVVESAKAKQNEKKPLL